VKRATQSKNSGVAGVQELQNGDVQRSAFSVRQSAWRQAWRLLPPPRSPWRTPATPREPQATSLQSLSGTRLNIGYSETCQRWKLRLHRSFFACYGFMLALRLPISSWWSELSMRAQLCLHPRSHQSQGKPQISGRRRPQKHPAGLLPNRQSLR
jgi:hypothetical protein